MNPNFLDMMANEYSAPQEGGADSLQAAPPMPDEEATESPSSGTDLLQELKAVIAHVNQVVSLEPDEEDKAVLTGIIQKLQALLAKDQREADAAMGVSPGQKFLRNQRLMQ